MTRVRREWLGIVALALLVLVARLAAGQAAPASSAAASTISSPAGYRISGRLVDENTGQGIAGARITLSESVTSLPSAAASGVAGPRAGDLEAQAGQAAPNRVTATSSTGGDGAFLFDELPAGRFQLRAEKRGYLPQSFMAHGSNFSAGSYFSAVVTGPDQDTSNLIFSLPPEADIRGRVTDEAGEAVRNAQVMLYRESSEGGRGQVRRGTPAATNDLGVYRFLHLQAGRYYIAVHGRPWYAQNLSRLAQTAAANNSNVPRSNPLLDVAYPTTYFASATDSSNASPIELRPGTHAQADLTLTPVPSAHLRVDVPLPDGGAPNPGPPAVNLQAMALSFGTPMIGGAQMQYQNGVWELYGIAPGSYRVSSTSPDRSAARARVVQIGSDTEMRLQDAPLSGHVHGMLQVTGNLRPQQVLIRFRDVASDERSGAQTKTDGSFEHVLEPGTYEVFATGGNGAFLQSLSVDGVQLEGRRLRIGGGENITLRANIATGAAQVEGVVTRGGKPAVGVMVLLVPAPPLDIAPLMRVDQSNTDGSFTLRFVPPGNYTLVALENWELEWQRPEVLRPYLRTGKPVSVGLQGRSEVKLEIQP